MKRPKHYIYIIVDKDQQARYIGRTNDYRRRKQEHEREGKLVGCDMYVLSYSYS